MDDAASRARHGTARATDRQVLAGQAVYSRHVLALYDWFVLGFSNHCVWRCPTRHLLAQYDRHITANHLEVGVGTGYFLDRCRFPVRRPRLLLLDLNPNSLAATARRVARYCPQVVRANALEPFPVGGPPFDSVGINYLLHCLPGDLRAKARVLDHAAAVLNGGGVIFGATLLGRGVRVGFLARRLSRLYNARGIFWNDHDSLEDLQEVLRTRFPVFTLQVIGCVALFAAGRRTLA
jgi:SAM-dependent methyltransferase